jgi:dimethylhistidine N-methyltransferase
LISANLGARLAAFAHDVEQGLTADPKRLSCCYFYDPEGSRLFEEICDLPEYYLTRAEREIFEARATEVAGRFPAGVRLIELGSGSAAKTRLLIEAFLARQPRLLYFPIDICRMVLEDSSRDLLTDYPALEIVAIEAEYQDALRHLASEEGLPRLILWLGSNVGNLDRDQAAAFLRQVRQTMSPEDRLLVGIDLRKPREILEPAYDDARGVTADFNLNLLTRINRELGGQFDVRAFRHRAIYNDEAGRVEMYLISQRDQQVRIDRLGRPVALAAGEAIHTENSYKYSPAEIAALAAGAGLYSECQWLDQQARFSVNLFAPDGERPAVV